jgi:hypothetical protein
MVTSDEITKLLSNFQPMKYRVRRGVTGPANVLNSASQASG